MIPLTTPDPEIRIVCQRTPVAGHPEQFRMTPHLSYGQMPGGWATVHMLLLDCLRMVTAEMVKEASGHQQRLIEVAAGNYFPQG